MDYIGYYRKTILNTLIGCMVWSGLSTYVIISKGQLGENNIPIFESIIFLISIATSRYIAKNRINYATACILDISLDFVCLVTIFVITILNGVGPESAIGLYVLIIITNGITGILTQEAERDLEDRTMKSESAKRFLKLGRGWHRDYRLYGLAIGSSISLILLTYFHMDLKIYALLLLGLNILQVVYDGYLVKRYLYRH